MKNVINTFTKTAENPRVTFIGNLSLGKDVSLRTLRDVYNAVVLVITVSNTLSTLRLYARALAQCELILIDGIFFLLFNVSISVAVFSIILILLFVSIGNRAAFKVLWSGGRS